MDLFNKLNLQPAQSEPRVWVRRLMVIKRVKPIVVVRDTHLTRGLNIVWAKDGEDDIDKQQVEGHSAGKTTFCRFMRYVLGEQTFGKKDVMTLIRDSFPNGYIAAEVHVLGKNWAVRRPIGKGQLSYIMENSTIEELLELQGRSVGQESYLQELGFSRILGKLDTGKVVQTGEQIQWPHILAWCTRDQEARFQSIYKWRSRRSQSDTPSFRFPKNGSLFVMRAVLGLFLRDELSGEERLVALQHKKDNLSKDIRKKSQEIEFQIINYEYRLKKLLQSSLPSKPDIESLPFRFNDLISEDLERLTTNTRVDIEASIARNELEQRSIQEKIDEFGVDVRQLENKLNELNALFDIGSAECREIEIGKSTTKDELKEILEVQDKLCPLGDVIFRECSHIIKRQSILKIADLQDAKAIEAAQVQRAAELKNLDEVKTRIQNSMNEIQKKRQVAIDERDRVMDSVRQQKELSSELQRTCDALAMWVNKRDNLASYEEINLLHKEIAKFEDESTKIKNELSQYFQQKNKNHQQLATIFSEVVRLVLPSGGYDGQIDPDNREFNFRITHGPTMSGEAMETLAVLLADITCLIYNTVNDKAMLPGLLIHDSPREADLGAWIYRNFIRFAASLQKYFGAPNECPFQYIITTTTPPPKEIQNNPIVKLNLNGAKVDEMFLCCNVANQKGKLL